MRENLFVSFMLVLFFSISINSQTFFVDSSVGNDSFQGTEAKPFKTLLKAAEVVNNLDADQSVTIKVQSGVYNLNEIVKFEKGQFTKEKRLTIEAVMLPNDTSWLPHDMPVITSTAAPTQNFGFPCALGLDVEVSHVTIRGLKFTGNPYPYVYYYPIAREGRELVDLEITQCMFVGDIDASPVQSGVLAHGHEVVVDHCIFSNCKNSVVYFWVDAEKDAVRRGSAMRYCIVNRGYETGIWTSTNDNNFQFHNNIISNCNIAWMHNYYNKTEYVLSNSILVNNERAVVTTTEDYTAYIDSPVSYKYENVKSEGEIEYVQKEDVVMPRDYLHVKAGTFGSKLGAGLFVR